MDNDKQIPLKFLDEAEDCCDRIESTVLGLADTIADPQALDEALRAAHSVKGGAAMMGFTTLSHVSHQLEDYFKILRVRYHSKSIDTAVETLLLQGLDRLRHAIDLHRHGGSIDETEFATESQPIFDRLRQHLGELRPEDEDALLSQEGDVNPAILLFESGVGEALDFLEERLPRLSPVQLLQELTTTADELSEFGRMAKLDRFIALCASVKNQSQNNDLAGAMPLARQALKIWRKSHAVVLLGRFEKIPDRLPGSVAPSITVELDDSLSDQERFNPALVGMEGLIEMDLPDLSQLQFELANFDLDLQAEFTAKFAIPAELRDELASFTLPDSVAGLADNWDDSDLDLKSTQQPSLELLTELASFEMLDSTSTFDDNWDDLERSADVDSILSQQPSLELLGEFAAFEIPDLPLMGSEESQLTDVMTTLEIVPVLPSAPSQPKTTTNRQTVRVPVEYLQQFNNIFGKLILERNAINLRLTEIHNYTGILQKRMQQLESSNQELRQWYDRAATETLIPATADPQLSVTSPHLTLASPSSPAMFDLLEMDRYSDLHLVSQGQIETIVQLQEVTADIELSLREMTHSVQGFNQTTRSMQSNLTRTQMLPFADLVKRFPRLIRDLSVQFGKSVTLQIVGENTGIDRAILDNLSDPLIHLLRNAFDHGIEDPATRLAAGKPEQGTIVLAASERGGETEITISDDGGGIRLDRICQRLQQIGLPSAAVAQMSAAELLDTIFEPGFSTSTSLTELSGRGVGMDVVRTNIEQIRGTIRVKTQPGVGTTFIIRVPFTLSIVRIMLLERAGFVFAVAVDSIREMISFQPDLLCADGQIAWNSQVIPLVALEQGISFGRNYRSLALPGTPTIAKPTVLVVGEDNRSIAFKIDRFWGEREVTRRSIDSLMPLTPGFGNSIILGDGRVVPLIDLIQLADWMATHPNTPTNLASTARLIPTEIARSQPDPILVIDDSSNVRRYLAVMLEKAGYRVEQAKDGQEAVEKLFGGLVVQAVLCDVEMPRLDGYGVLEALRSDEKFKDLPIVMLTSRSSSKHRQLAMNLGASAYFSKPYIESDLLAALSSYLTHNVYDGYDNDSCKNGL